MAFCGKLPYILVIWACLDGLATFQQDATPGLAQRKPFFERFRRLEEQFRRFQELSLTQLQGIAEKFNISSNIEARFRTLMDQYDNLSAVIDRFHTSEEDDLKGLKMWMKKLQKKSKNIDLKMSTLEKIFNERRKQVAKHKKVEDLVIANLTTEAKVQRSEISSLVGGRNKLQKEIDTLREEVKDQGIKMAKFEEQMESTLQNDALAAKPSSSHLVPATSTPLHLLRSLNEAPRSRHRFSNKEGTICNVDSMLYFPTPSTDNYVRFGKGFSSGLFEMTICTWLNTPSDYLGTILSYATEDNDNKLVLHGRNASKQSTIHFVIGDPAFRELPVVSLLDGRWHHICIIWSSIEGKYWYYIDRRLTAAGSKFQKGYEIPTGGTLVVGQEQDNMGGGFDETESFVGVLAGFTVWNRALSPGEISSIATGKTLPRGKILTFGDISTLSGTVQHVNCTCLDRCW
uniref:Pentraxin 4 n=1 Tax=Callorhinchus milii TaxID=7868 RepID=A0A4W3I2H9_CALMI|eukprot:gi/632952617/ref/XP_007891948.1/ PREDICTED: pentraxin-4 [Callorhinchus milii]